MAGRLRGTVWWKAGRGEGSNLWKAPKGNALRGNGRDGNRPERSGEADVKNARVDAGYQGCSEESCWRGEVSTCTIPGGEDPRDVGNGGMGSGDAAGRGCLMVCRES